MKIVGVQNKVISVLGLPHSGTTILCNTLNSMSNGFCLSEPHWTMQTKPHLLKFDKVGRLPIKSADDVLWAVRKKIVSDDRFDFGGVKETYRPRNDKIAKYLIKVANKSDIVLFVFRDPKALLNNFKKEPINHMPMERLLHIYNSLFNLYQSKRDKSAAIILEDYCDSGNAGAIKYLNSRCSGLFKVQGNFAVKPTNYLYGDRRANNSTGLMKANRGIALLNKKEKKIIDKMLLPKYEDIRNTI